MESLQKYPQLQALHFSELQTDHYKYQTMMETLHFPFRSDSISLQASTHPAGH